jgi:hypothetical protein
MRSPSSSSSLSNDASTDRTEMKDRSATISSNGPPTAPTVRSRMSVRSRQSTRGSARSRSCSWPRPTSTATTVEAPAWSKASVKPPVEAPASRQRRPVGSMAKRCSAPASFSPPRETKRGGGPTSRRASAADTSRDALSAGALLTRTRPASIRARACDRVSLKPRRWSSISRRRRVAVVWSLGRPPEADNDHAGGSVGQAPAASAATPTLPWCSPSATSTRRCGRR